MGRQPGDVRKGTMGLLIYSPDEGKAVYVQSAAWWPRLLESNRGNLQDVGKRARCDQAPKSSPLLGSQTHLPLNPGQPTSY